MENNICRICANHGCNYHPLFDSNENSIINKIHNCLPIIIQPNDKLPAHICNNCLEAVEMSDKLRTKCLLADSILRKKLIVVLERHIEQKECEPVKESKVALPLMQLENLSAISQDIGTNQFKQWICDVCGGEFKNSDRLQKHKSKNHEEQIDNVEQSNNLNNSNNSMNFMENQVEIKQEVNPDPISIDILTDISKKDETEFKTQCNICKVKIKDKKFMELHSKFHQPRSSYCCHCCNTFTNPYELYKHKKTVHMMWRNLEMKWFCDNCETMIPYIYEMRKHVKMCTAHKLSCKYCDNVFENKEQLTNHHKKNHYDSMMNDPLVEKFCCEYCGNKYFENTDYMFHMQWHRTTNNLNHKCIHCGIILESALELSYHIESDHCCTQNKKRTAWEQQMAQQNEQEKNGKRMKTHEISQMKLLPPEIVIDGIQSNEHDQQKNEVIQTNITQKTIDCKTVRLSGTIVGHLVFKCTECSETFNTEQNLIDHQRYYHQFTCTRCKKQFVNMVSLAQHWIKIHRVQLASVPEQHQTGPTSAGESFNTWPDYNVLQMPHFKRSPQEKGKLTLHCNYCGKFYKEKSSFQRHMKQHRQGSWKFDCDLCHTKFRTDDTLKSHSKIHEGIEKAKELSSFYCEHCGKGFAEKKYLKKHMYLHLPEEDWLYQCDKCDIKLRTLGALRKHEKSHKNSPSDTSDTLTPDPEAFNYLTHISFLPNFLRERCLT